MLEIFLLIVIFLGVAKQAGWLVLSWQMVMSPLLLLLGMYAIFAIICLILFIGFVYWTSKH